MTWFYVVVPMQSREMPLRNYVFGPYKTQDIAQAESDKLGGWVEELPTRDRDEAQEILASEGHGQES